MEVAEVLRQRYRINARVVLRYAHGWSQRQAADEWNRRWPDELKTFTAFSYWEGGRVAPGMLHDVGLFREERELMGMEHNGWLLKLFHYCFAHYLDEPVFLIRRGHRRDHLASVWDDNPDRSHVFDTVLVPRSW
ncbi:MAG: hypothetical protein ACRDTA_06465 [Pseudonocardiaceae bacterium]